jgi:hypothetical protein
LLLCYPWVYHHDHGEPILAAAVVHPSRRADPQPTAF